MNQKPAVPDSSAVRVALWRAMHVQIDAAPAVLSDEIGLKLAAPDPSWRERPDMHPQGTRGYRASIVGRARYIEDLVEEQLRSKGAQQYVILGAGLDTFVQRRPDLASSLNVFEIDKPDTQAWKRRRLTELGLPLPKFVPVDFEAGESWREKLLKNGFDARQPAVIVSTGVSMYLTREANEATLREVAGGFAPGSIFAMSFLLTMDLIDPAERAQHQMVYERAKAAGTPFLSFFPPQELLRMARAAGFKDARHVSREDIIAKYFSGRSDGLQPSSGEEFLIALT